MDRRDFPGYWLWRWSDSLAGIALCAGLTLVAAPLLAQDISDVTQNPLAGSQVFGSKGCVKCHAVNGLGGTVGPDLGRIARRRSFYELAATMWNHLPSMGRAMEEHGIERPQLTSREAGDLIAFLFTLDYFDPPGDVEAGKRLFVEKKCVVCHQVGLYGGTVGPSLDHLSQFGSPILVAAAMWNHGPAMAREMAARGIARPTFDGTELTDLISYLESVGPTPLGGPLYVLPGRAEEGRVVFSERKCIECHSARGEGGRIGPDLAERGRQIGLTEFAAAMWNKAPAMMEALEQRGIDLPRLGAGEMADLVAYLYAVQYFSEKGDPAVGRQLAHKKDCVRCHSLGGRGGTTARDLAALRGMDSPAAVVAALWNHSGLMESARPDARSTWPKFSPKEMADLAAFMQRPRR